MEKPMKHYLTATLLMAALATPAFAAATTRHYGVVDTVGNCAVLDMRPSPYKISGMKILGQKDGYPSISAALNVLKSDPSQCKGTVQRT
jgi:hypothetical protein